MPIPRLDGIPSSYRATGDRGLALRYAEAFVKSGYGDPALWKGNLSDFLTECFCKVILRDGHAEKVWSRFDLKFSLSTYPESEYLSMDERRGPGEYIYVNARVCNVVGVVNCGKTLDLFEGLEKDAGASVVAIFLRHMHMWWPTYSFWQAQDSFESMLEMVEDGDEGNAPPPLPLPASLSSYKFRGCSLNALEQLSRGSRTATRIVARLKAFCAIARRESRRRWTPEDEAFMEDAYDAIPVLLTRLHEDDETSGYFDEWVQQESNSGVDHHPAFFERISSPDPKLIRGAMRRVSVAVQTLSAAVDLIDAMPGNKSTRL